MIIRYLDPQGTARCPHPPSWCSPTSSKQSLCSRVLAMAFRRKAPEAVPSVLGVWGLGFGDFERRAYP